MLESEARQMVRGVVAFLFSTFFFDTTFPVTEQVRIQSFYDNSTTRTLAK